MSERELVRREVEDDDGKLVGFVTERDFLRVAVELSASQLREA